MALVIPPGIESDGADLLVWAPTLADPSTPTVADAAGSSAFAFACYLTNTFDANASQDTTDDKRYCSPDVSQIAGKTTWSIGQLEYITDPQNPESVSNKAAMAMVEGSKGFIIRRMGKDVETAPELVAGDYVEVYSVTLGPQVLMPGEAGQLVRVKQELTGVRRIVSNYKLTA